MYYYIGVDVSWSGPVTDSLPSTAEPGRVSPMPRSYSSGAILKTFYFRSRRGFQVRKRHYL